MRFTTLQQWLDWQETLHPEEIELGLDRIATVWQRLNPAGLDCPVITVAGTNGKGSSVAMLESILLAARYRAGCYTSPHLFRYNERIRVDGREVDDESLCQAFAAVDEARGTTSLTYFEFGTLAALYLFAHAGLDVVILEVGLGGRLDAVNIIDSDVALLTSVGIDHTDWLGETREQIGAEKAGIFRSGCAAICADREPPQSVLAAAKGVGADLWLAGKDYDYRVQAAGWDWQGRRQHRNSLPLPSLRGRVQLDNAAGVLAALEALSECLPVNQGEVRLGLQETSLPGRFQVIPGDVTWILDVSHNPDGIAVLAENLERTACQGRTLAVFSMLSDKEIERAASRLDGLVDGWYVGGLETGRGLSGDELARRLARVVDRRQIAVSDTVARAAHAAVEAARPGDRVLVFGSFYTVAEAWKACL